MNWEVITWTCLTVAALIAIAGLIITLISFRTMRKKKNELTNVHTELKTGSEIMFSNGIYGTVKRVDDETVYVEIAKGTVIKISRYAINEITA